MILEYYESRVESSVPKIFSITDQKTKKLLQDIWDKDDQPTVKVSVTKIFGCGSETETKSWHYNIHGEI